MTTTIAVDTITTQHLRALKNADRITFSLTDGQGYLRAHRDGENTPSGFSEQVDIHTHTRLEDYNGQRGDVDTYAAYHWIGYPKVDHTWHTLMSRITKDCTLLLRWTADNNNDVQRSVGFHRDELRLVIARPNGKAETYLVAVQVGPDNTARMIRRSRYSL